MIERGEVVVVQLDLGSLHHPVAEADEDVLDLALGSDQRVLCPDRNGRSPGQRDVDRTLRQLGAQLAGVELGGPRLEQSLQLAACLVAGLAHRTPLLLGEVGDAAQDLGELGLPAQEADTELLQLVGGGGRPDRIGRLPPDLFYPLSHDWPRTLSAAARSPPLPRR